MSLPLIRESDLENIQILQNKEYDFVDACMLLELDPGKDLKGTDLREVNFGTCDLSGFNFSNADLSNSRGTPTGINNVVLSDAIVSKSPFEANFLNSFDNWDELSSVKKNSVLSRNLLAFSEEHKLNLLSRLLKNKECDPRLICSLVWLIGHNWEQSNKLVHVFDEMIDHEYPSVRIAGVKAAERVFGSKAVVQMYKFKMLGEAWADTRRAVYFAYRDFESSYSFKANGAMYKSWLDPVNLLTEGVATRFSLDVSLPDHLTKKPVSERQSQSLKYLQALFQRTNMMFLTQSKIKILGVQGVVNVAIPYVLHEEKEYLRAYRMPFFLPTSFNEAIYSKNDIRDRRGTLLVTESPCNVSFAINSYTTVMLGADILSFDAAIQPYTIIVSAIGGITEKNRKI